MYPARTVFLLLMLPLGSVQAQRYTVKSDSASVRVDVPATVIAGFKKVFPVIPRDIILRWQVSGPATNYYYVVDVGRQSAEFYATGAVTATLLEVQMSGLPKPVQRRVQRSILKEWRQAKPGTIRAYARIVDGDLWYYIISYCNPLDESIYRKCDWKIEPNGHFFNPKFR